MKTRIRLLALQNAVRYGTADANKVISKVLADYPEARSTIAKIREDVLSITKDVNRMLPEQQKAELEQQAPELLEKKKGEKREGLKPLANAEQDKVVMRFEPSPSGPLHIGHAYVLLLNEEYCRMYGGKLILRISDTNPDNIDVKSYGLIRDNAEWLCKNIKLEYTTQSDRMETYYHHALQLFEEGHAYVCECDAEEAKQMIAKGEECECRRKGQAEQLQRWHKMFEGYDAGDAVVRLKTDIRDKNPAMRDFAIFRINETEHPRQGKKYRVWPMMNFAVAIDDHDMGLTHVLRGKDHYDNTKRQKWIYDYFKWEYPEYLHIGRINFEGLPLSASETRRAIDEGKYTGWDDIRLPFISALKRRGYQPEAFMKYAIATGVTMADKTVQGSEFFKAINAFNRETIEPGAKRFFFVENPVDVVITNAPTQHVELDLHPAHITGGRRFATSSRFYLAKADVIQLNDGELFRLMDCLNAVKSGKSDAASTAAYTFHSKEHSVFKEHGSRIIHWLPKEGRVMNVIVHMQDGTTRTGYGEEGMAMLMPDDMVQLERFGYCRVDSVVKESDTVVFWFTHP